MRIIAVSDKRARGNRNPFCPIPSHPVPSYLPSHLSRSSHSSRPTLICFALFILFDPLCSIMTSRTKILATGEPPNATRGIILKQGRCEFEEEEYVVNTHSKPTCKFSHLGEG
jgi:hypothetical protein